jgi:hypothetical protein
MRVSCLVLFVITSVHVAQAVGEEKQEKAVRFVPLVTSTPLTGTGLGGAVSYLYAVGEGSAKSQLQAGAQYSNTDSINHVYSQ